MYGRTKIFLDERRDVRLSADEIAEWADYTAFSKPFALTKQARGRRCEANPLAFKLLESIQLALERSVRFFSSQQDRPCRRVRIT